jgi:hypothetical protein
MYKQNRHFSLYSIDNFIIEEYYDNYVNYENTISDILDYYYNYSEIFNKKTIDVDVKLQVKSKLNNESINNIKKNKFSFWKNL